ncbi:MAG: hypothetical protein HGB32_01110 [Geobacteraceae bacterium]|nr:hypothetical protein [Geobacteraceae bacterium]NTW78730.1 hypothetical protein [Geobacteraceae bacterium]
MPYTDKLQRAFTSSLITKIAIIDDGFDIPSCSDLEADAIIGFRTILNEYCDDPDEDASNIIEELENIEDRPSLQTIIDRVHDDEGVLAFLWKTYRELNHGSNLKKMLHKLFIPFVVDKDAKLAPLEELSALVQTTTGIVPDTFGSDTMADSIVGYDLIFLDYYLNPDASPSLTAGDDVNLNANFIQGKQHSIELLKSVVKNSGNKIPLVMLISSVAKAEDIPDFRAHAKMLASKINYLPKGQVKTNPHRAQHAILGLVQYRKEADALWDLIDLWKQSVNSASDNLISMLLELDLPDYSYLQSYRLNDEKVPLAHYLGWLFNGYLSNLVEESISQSTAHELSNRISLPLPIPGRIAPTEAITSLYSGVTTSKVPRLGEGFKPNAWAGDIFIKTSSYNKIFGRKHAPKGKLKEPMPEVLCVITPSCDLIPGRSNNAKSVTMIGGILVPMDGLAPPTNHLLLLDTKPYHVSWDSKWPVTVDISDVNGMTLLGKHYRWVSRLRDVYHAELQHLLFKDIGRVGVPVVPTMPICVDMRVLVKQHGKPYKVLLDRKANESSVWTFKTKKSDTAYCIREEIAWELQGLVKKLAEEESNKVNDKALEYALGNDFIEKLQSPIVMTSDSRQLEKTGITVKQVADAFKEDGTSHQTSFILAVSQKKLNNHLQVI